MRVAVISHTYVIAANRGKLAALARLPGLELLAITPARWRNRDTAQTVAAEPRVDSQCRMAVLAAWCAGPSSLLIYSPSALFQVLRDFRPDIVHLEEEPWTLAAFETMIVCRLVGAPLTVFTWENVERRLPPPFGLIRRLVFRRARAAIAGNLEAKSLLERNGFPGPVTVLPQLGVDTAPCAPSIETSEADVALVGYIGRLVPQKGLLVLVEALAQMPKRFRLSVVGSGPLKAELHRRAGALGIEERLELREDVRHDEVPRYLRRLSVLVLPSLTTPTWKEQFGHVLIEAMACGVPVVASDSGAIPEVVGDAGLLVREGNAAELASALESLLSDPALRRTLAHRGRARALAHYANEVVAERLATIWKDVLS